MEDIVEIYAHQVVKDSGNQQFEISDEICFGGQFRLKDFENPQDFVNPRKTNGKVNTKCPDCGTELTLQYIP